ncbi:T9SS type A sorting domain-containing protein [Flavobacterium caeni]|uniref:Por secretion system C-terminal sorting domain-containing protein n=1 Tax=Flavobacterium caeni TaxID=490189 RepID=A0A1G5IKZ9_9FLAO|nr:T9SS type A sorting domain-containing protein [Flavobacterium caeni]SCY76390.1 Por secretion system C-terminal sorting domain-containing protein [Flavobacterium caeni]
MKLKITLSLITCLSIGHLFSQGFGSTPTTWPIPQGGHTYSTINYGFDALGDSAGGILGDQTWSVMDMNGDGRPDLVVTAQTVEFEQFSNQAIAFGSGSNRYWKVYLNSGNGFSATSINWPIPQGGHTYSTINYGYDALYGMPEGQVGDQTWSVIDLNNDNKPDLVVTAETVEFEQFSNQAIAFGTGSNRYWKVYWNTGSGFNTTPTNWTIPQGGHTYSTINYGFDALADSAGSSLGDQTWSVSDMNGDGKPDLVVTAQKVEFEQFSDQAIAFGSGSNRYWKVYLNNGSGFATTSTNWPIPQGGHTYSTINYGYDALAASAEGTIGDQTWSVLDMNNDNKPDLVVTAERKAYAGFSDQATAFGTGSNRYWKVFLNTGSGFNATSTNWTIPQGGHTYSTINYGYDALAASAEGTIGDQTWSVLDMNSDNKPDLVVTAERKAYAGFSDQATAFGTGSNRYWKVFLNNGTGFATTSANWPIPQGGHTYSTIDYGYDALADSAGGNLGDQTWSVLDMNNDNKPDLVVTAQTVEFEQFSNQAIAFGTGSSRYWKVFLNSGLLETGSFTSDASAVVVYPNPSNGQFHVATHAETNDIDLKVVDLSGRVILHQTNSKTIDLSGFPKGVYILNVGIGEASYSKKLMLK